MPAMCPICSATIAVQETACSKCHTDLSAYLAVQYAPDLLYNEAAALIESGDFRAAYDKLAAAHYMRPHDAEIVVAMSQCCELSGDYMGAMEKLAMLIVNNESDSLKQEYERLNVCLEEQKRKNSGHGILDAQMYAELKDLVLQNMRESTEAIIASAAQAILQKDAPGSSAT
jgi:tetratricopeptide (TPR) repeat protein